MEESICKFIKNIREPKSNSNIINDKSNRLLINLLLIYFKNYNLILQVNRMFNAKNEYDVYMLVGLFYFVNNNYDEMIKYYLISIEKDNLFAMNTLGLFYEEVEINYENAIKYYSLAAEKGDKFAMSNLMLYYSRIEKNKHKVNEYYKNVMEIDEPDEFYKLGFHYEMHERNYIEMEKYYLMAINKKHIQALQQLISYYKKNNENNKIEQCLMFFNDK